MLGYLSVLLRPVTAVINAGKVLIDALNPSNAKQWEDEEEIMLQMGVKVKQSDSNAEPGLIVYNPPISGTVVNAPSGLNKRSGASAQSDKVGSVSNGTELTIVGEKDGFYKLSDGSYVSKDYVKKSSGTSASGGSGSTSSSQTSTSSGSGGTSSSGASTSSSSGSTSSSGTSSTSAKEADSPDLKIYGAKNDYIDIDKANGVDWGTAAMGVRIYASEHGSYNVDQAGYNANFLIYKDKKLVGICTECSTIPDVPKTLAKPNQDKYPAIINEGEYTVTYEGANRNDYAGPYYRTNASKCMRWSPASNSFSEGNSCSGILIHSGGVNRNSSNQWSTGCLTIKTTVASSQKSNKDNSANHPSTTGFYNLVGESSCKLKVVRGLNTAPKSASSSSGGSSSSAQNQAAWIKTAPVDVWTNSETPLLPRVTQLTNINTQITVTGSLIKSYWYPVKVPVGNEVKAGFVAHTDIQFTKHGENSAAESASNIKQRDAWITSDGTFKPRFRKETNPNSELIKELNKGDKVIVTGEKTGKLNGYEWYVVTSGGKVGYVVAEYVVFSPPSSTPATWPKIEQGSSGGPNTYAAQYLLNHWGQSPALSVDGAFGSKSSEAVKSFQTKKSIPADGVIGDSTWVALTNFTQSKSSHTANAAKAIQHLLKEKFSMSISVDGAYGSGTETAVKSFQQSMSISSSGTVDAATWKSLICSAAKAITSSGSTTNTSTNTNSGSNVVVPQVANAEIQKILNNIKNSSNIPNEKKDSCIATAKVMLENGFAVAYVVGMLANIKHEGNAGLFEGSNYSKNPSLKPDYLVYMDANHNYATEYSNKAIYDKNLTTVYNILTDFHNKNWKIGSSRVGFGLGSIQWTFERTYDLVKLYREVNGSKDKITKEQVIEAESKMIARELAKSSYSGIYSTWKGTNSAKLNSQDAAYDAGYKLCQNYEKPKDTNQYSIRADFAKKIYPEIVKDVGTLPTPASNPTSTPTSTPQNNQTAAKVDFGYSDSNADKITSKSMDIIKAILDEAKITVARISSTRRSPEDQARIMYDNCKSTGVTKQYALYGATGDKIIAVYDAGVKANKSEATIKSEMKNKIIEVGCINVSKHCATVDEYNKYNVFDIGLNSVKGDLTTLASKLNAAVTAGKIAKFIDERPNSINCFHIEIKQ